MNLAQYIKEFLNGMLDLYRDYFKKTYEAAFIISLITVICAAIFLFQAPEYVYEHIRRYSFLSLFNKTAAVPYCPYHLIDMFKPLCLILVTLFAIGFSRSVSSGKFRFLNIISNITANDLGNLLIAAIAAAGTDILLYYLQYSLVYRNEYPLYPALGTFRTYLPFLYLALAYSYSVFDKGFRISLQSVLYLFACAFICNVIVNNVHSLIEIILQFLFIAFPSSDTRILLEIIIAVPVISLYVIGYAFAISFPAKYFDRYSASSIIQEDIDPEIHNEV